MSKSSLKAPKISVVVPLMNEELNVKPLVESIEKALKGTNFEIILVDDGSTDDTIKNALALKNKKLKLVEFTRNFGQTSAMAAGIEYAKGEFIATMDGDMQNDPSDILPMLEKLEKEKLDILNGIRAKRKDGFILRKIPSKIANWLIRKVTKVHITDLGCSLKILRSEVAKKLDLFGELHRFIPIIASIYGAKIGEVAVKHHSRKFGETKYGLGRTFRVLSDLFLMVFFIKYRQKPMHLFGSLGIATGVLSFFMTIYLLVIKVLGGDIGGRPIFFVDILMILMSIQFITTGFLAELLMRTYFASDKSKPYIVKKVHEFK